MKAFLQLEGLGTTYVIGGTKQGGNQVCYRKLMNTYYQIAGRLDEVKFDEPILTYACTPMILGILSGKFYSTSSTRVLERGFMKFIVCQSFLL